MLAPAVAAPCPAAQPQARPLRQGGVSPAWESISAQRHLLLMLCQPCHALTVYKARPSRAPSTPQSRQRAVGTHMRLDASGKSGPHVRPTWVAPAAQLPAYAPSEAEARDPALFARNVRAYMVRAPYSTLTPYP